MNFYFKYFNFFVTFLSSSKFQLVLKMFPGLQLASSPFWNNINEGFRHWVKRFRRLESSKISDFNHWRCGLCLFFLSDSVGFFDVFWVGKNVNR